MYVPGRYNGVLDLRPFAGNILTSDPVRYARNAAILEAEPALGLGGPTVTWCRRRVSRHARVSTTRAIPRASASRS